VPPKPAAPDRAALAKIADALIADRTNAQHMASAAPIADPSSPSASPDLFGRLMKVTEVAVGDELAAAASLVMGQGAEGTPIVHVRGFRNRAPENDAAALIRPKDMDMFR